MEKFIARYGSAVTAVLSGLDRLVLGGTLLPLGWERGMHTFLARAGVRRLDFKQYAIRITEQLITRWIQEALNHDRPMRYLGHSQVDKEDLARRLLQDHPLQRELICMFRAIEPCMTFEYHRAPDPAQRGLRLQTGKCLHLYQYYLHPRFGFIGSRIQTWFPCNVQIWLNGREWLACQMQRRGCPNFTRCDNCFTWLGNPALTQRLTRGEFATAGFRNRDLRGLLYPAHSDSPPDHHRRLSARVSRQLRLLRAHALIRKIPRSHRYQLTQHGRLLPAALFAARQSTIAKLVGSAAA